MENVVILSCVRTPIGATGAMRLTTLINELVRRKPKLGMETICGGGGHGICLIVERK